jgi:glycosyltransferase involved in cell wall biosynthesis
MTDNISASLIICTRNRAGPLRRCLDYIRLIEFKKSWELVIVDNGSTDDTEAVIKAFAKEIDIPVIYIYEKIPGLSNARNAGVKNSSGELILFTDDDCYVDPHFIDVAHEKFSDPAIGFVSGRIRLFDPDDYPATINESTTPLRLEAGKFIPAGTLKGASMAFRRKVLDQIGPFDPLFGSGAFFPSEDADAIMRASLAGWVGLYEPAMIVHHHHGRKAADIGSLHKSYDIGRGAYHAKLLFIPGGQKIALKAWAGLAKRLFVRRSLFYWEMYGAIHYFHKRNSV